MEGTLIQIIRKIGKHITKEQNKQLHKEKVLATLL